MDQTIKTFFYPSSICLIGASTKEKSIGYELLKTIKKFGYTGKIFPVNPKADKVLDYRCFKSIDEIPAFIELAIIVVPKQLVEESIELILQKGVKSILLITAGFREIGKEGEEIEKRLVEKVVSSGGRLVGPNCMGIINTLDEIRLNATFVAERPAKGSTGFLSQSGALGAAVLNSLRETDIKFAHFISVGNKADVNENTILSFWQSDENIKTMTFYLESFVNGEEFIKRFTNSKVSKPVIVLKAGKSTAGMKAASSHTGALGSRDLVVDAVLKQFGIIRVKNLNEMFNTAKGFENFPIPKGNKIAVVTNAGGPGILAVDNIEKEKLQLAELTDETKAKLREIVHPEGSIENPVDLLPGGTAEHYKKVVELVAADRNVDAVISIFVEPVMVQPFDVVEAVSSVVSEKPILQVDMPLPEFWDTYRKYSKKHLPIFKNPEDPAEVLSNMLFHAGAQKQKVGGQEQYNFTAVQQKKYNLSPGFITQDEINKIASDYNLPVIKNKIIKVDDIGKLSDDFYPLVIKGINSKVVHKSELKAVKLNIKNKEELILAANEIRNNFTKFKFDVEGFLIQPFIKPKHEVLIGGFRDYSFGPIIMFGAGGKYVEIICDTSIKSAYLAESDIEDMIEETTIGKILKGVRGEEPVNLNELKSIIWSASAMLIENENIEEFDFNPLIISENNSIHAVDIRIKFR